MTAAGFTRLADALRDARYDEYRYEQEQFDAVIERCIVPVLRQENTRFDSERFMAAVRGD